MNTIEKEVCTQLAFLWVREHKPDCPDPLRWSKAHWLDFITDLDTRTGQMLLECAKRGRQLDRLMEKHP